MATDPEMNALDPLGLLDEIRAVQHHWAAWTSGAAVHPMPERDTDLDGSCGASRSHGPPASCGRRVGLASDHPRHRHTGCIDGKVFRDHCMVIALGIDAAGRKHGAGPARRRHRDRYRHRRPVERPGDARLATDRTLLFVIDGVPGPHRAITDVFGSRGVVQRCHNHKSRNVLGHLPERQHASVGKALRDAWDLDSADRAERALERLARLAASLAREHPGAATSGAFDFPPDARFATAISSSVDPLPWAEQINDENRYQ